MQPPIPRKMIGNRVDIEEERPPSSFATDQIDGAGEVKAVGLETARAEIAHVQIVRDTGSRLKGARSQKRAIERIQAIGLIAAPLQRARQSAVDVTCGDPR